MLRSKQLLPIYKGARTWLVAGTTCGPRSNSVDGNSHPNVDEHRSQASSGETGGKYQADNITSCAVALPRRSSLIPPTSTPSPSSSKLLAWERSTPQPKTSCVDGSSNLARRTSYLNSSAEYGKRGDGQPVNNAKISETSSQTSCRQVILSAGAADGSLACSRKNNRYQRDSPRNNGTKAGLAAVDRFSNGDTGNEQKEKPSVSVVQKGNEKSNLVGSLPVPNNDTKSRKLPTISCKTKSDHIPVNGKENVSQRQSSRARPLSSNCYPGKYLSTGGDLASKDDFKPVQVTHTLVTAAHGINEGIENRSISGHASVSGNWKESNTSFGVPSSTHSVASIKNNEKSKAQHKQTELKACLDIDSSHQSTVLSNGASRSRSKAGITYQSRPCKYMQSATYFSGSRSTGKRHKIVDCLCDILARKAWGPETIQALSDLHFRLSPFHINEVLKEQNDADLAFNFFNWAKKQCGYRHDVHTYTTMVGILGRARRFDAIDHLLVEMIQDGCKPSVVTYNRLIHSYGRANHLEASQDIFNHMHNTGCKPDRVTYGTLINLHVKAGFYDTALGFYNSMQHAGYCPDIFTYSMAIFCLGKAGQLSAAYQLFSEMAEQGCPPTLVTYNTIIDLYAKAGEFDMALKLYRDMQEAGYRPDEVTSSIMMEVLGHSGRLEEAELTFFEMERAGVVVDATMYGLMVDLWAKSGNTGKAGEWFNRMLRSRVEVNVPAFNSLLNAYLRLKFYDVAKEFLQCMSKWGLHPTLQTYTLLLSCCKEQQHTDLILSLNGDIEHPAHSLISSLLATESTETDAPPLIRQFFDCIHFEEHESKRGFADSLIDFLHGFGLKSVAGHVWDMVVEKNLYPYTVSDKQPHYWSVNLHVMSIGTALVALSKSLVHFKKKVIASGIAPERVDIITGWGRRSRVEGACLVKHAVEHFLNSLGSPFHIHGVNRGCFISRGEPLFYWLSEPQVEQGLCY